MKITFFDNERGNPPGKLADAELHFDDGPFAGLKLIGFAVWAQRGGGGGRNVTFPARQYSVNGERRSFALLRDARASGGSVEASKAFAAAVLRAYDEHLAAVAGVALPACEAVQSVDHAVPAIADVPFSLSSEPARVAAVQDDLFSGVRS